MAKTFRGWDVNQSLMLPPSVRGFVPQRHLAHFVLDTVVENLDLSAILEAYTGERGFPLYDPAMMTVLHTPDFRTVNDFCKRNVEALKGLFVQMLHLCRGTGLVKLGHVVLGAPRFGLMQPSTRR